MEPESLIHIRYLIRNIVSDVEPVTKGTIKKLDKVSAMHCAEPAFQQESESDIFSDFWMLYNDLLSPASK